MTTPASALLHPKYRPDIDGLRALAVLSVVVFHAFPSWLPGGFTGVDVFFVISGFLISTIIIENLDQGSFSFAQFYARRIKRIFPSVLLVLSACYGFGWLSLFPNEYQQLGKHIAAGAGFVSNIILWRESGYFDQVAELKPLLHLWSLGIEEQFYIVFPVLLYLAKKRNFNLLSVISIVFLISLYLNIKGVKNNLTGAFYSPQTRFWELLAGSLLAWTHIYKKEWVSQLKIKADAFLVPIIYDKKLNYPGDSTANVLALIGFLLLVYSWFWINGTLAFPGKWAIIPVLGAMLIIFAGPNAWFNRVILSQRILVFFGLISFPLYLWHWPLLAFARIIEEGAPSRSLRIAALCLSVFLAWLSYQYIEKPIRFGKARQSSVLILSLLMLIVAYVGYNSYAREGLKFRKVKQMAVYAGDLGHIDYYKYVTKNYYPCADADVLNAAIEYGGFSRCKQSKASKDVDIVLLGDSHAEHLFMGVAKALPDLNVAFYIKNALPFLIDGDKSLPTDEKNFSVMVEAIKKSQSIKKVIISAFWLARINNLPEGTTLDVELLKTAEIFIQAGKEVYLTNDVPKFPFSAQSCQEKRPFSSKTPRCTINKTELEHQPTIEIIKAAIESVLKTNPKIRYIDINQYICDVDSCSMVKDDKLLYRDDNHLNINGTFWVGEALVKDHPELGAR